MQMDKTVGLIGLMHAQVCVGCKRSQGSQHGVGHGITPAEGPKPKCRGDRTTGHVTQSLSQHQEAAVNQELELEEGATPRRRFVCARSPRPELRVQSPDFKYQLHCDTIQGKLSFQPCLCIRSFRRISTRWMSSSQEVQCISSRRPTKTVLTGTT